MRFCLASWLRSICGLVPGYCLCSHRIEFFVATKNASDGRPTRSTTCCGALGRDARGAARREAAAPLPVCDRVRRGARADGRDPRREGACRRGGSPLRSSTFLGQGVAHATRRCAPPALAAPAALRQRRRRDARGSTRCLRPSAPPRRRRAFVARHAVQALVTCAASGAAPPRSPRRRRDARRPRQAGPGAGGPGPGARQAAVLRLT